MHLRSSIRRPAHLINVACLLILLGWPSMGRSEEPSEPREVGRVAVNKLREISGMVASRQNPGVLWIHNDGATKEAFAIRTDGSQAGRLDLPLAVVDPEDIAFGPGPEEGQDYLYLADIGDNDGQRPSIRVVRMLEPALSVGNNGRLRARSVEYFRFAYPDGAHDAEAFLVDPENGDLWFITKEKERGRVYVAAAGELESGPTIVLKLAAIVNHVQSASAGDISRDGRRIILRTEERGWLWNRPWGESVALTLSRPPQEIPVRGAGQGQNGESVAFHPDGLSYLTVSEGRNEGIFSFPLPPAAAEESR